MTSRPSSLFPCAISESHGPLGFVRANPRTVEPVFQWLQFAAASLISLGHGGDDTQNNGHHSRAAVSQGLLGSEFYLPLWVVITCQAAVALGTLIGGWRIVRTVGSNSRLTPVQGCCASATAPSCFSPQPIRGSRSLQRTP